APRFADSPNPPAGRFNLICKYSRTCIASTPAATIHRCQGPPGPAELKRAPSRERLATIAHLETDHDSYFTVPADVAESAGGPARPAGESGRREGHPRSRRQVRRGLQPR